MTSLDSICQGFLLKEGGIGHQYKNKKKRYFVLKDLFLFYFTEKPDESKPIKTLKGLLFIPGCSVKDNDSPAGSASSFILQSKEKEYILSVEPTITDAENYLRSWRNSLEYVIERASSWKEEPMNGFLYKRGGKGHGYKNWKKRWCDLRGNLLLYYDGIRQKDNDISQLKGYIEIAQIVELDAQGEQFSGYEHNFKLTLANGKEFIMAAKDNEEKTQWVNALKKRIKKISKLSHPINLDYKETAIRVGKLMRIIRGKSPITNTFVLSNLNLRFYKTEVTKESVEADWTIGLLGTIPLVGAAIFADTDGAAQMTIIDITGNRYTLAAPSSNELAEWTDMIRSTSIQLAKEIIRRGDTIRLNCLARNENQTNGYTVVNLDKHGIQLNFFMLKRKVEIPFKSLKRVQMTEDEIFCLRYENQQEIRVLNIICSNAKGVHDAINAAFEEVKSEKSKKSDGSSKKGGTPSSSPTMSKARKPKGSFSKAESSESVEESTKSKGKKEDSTSKDSPRRKASKKGDTSSSEAEDSKKSEGQTKPKKSKKDV